MIRLMNNENDHRQQPALKEVSSGGPTFDLRESTLQLGLSLVWKSIRVQVEPLQLLKYIVFLSI